MISDFPILSALLIIPLLGALIILPIKGETETTKRNIRNVALFTTLGVFILSIVMWGNFDASNPGFQFSEFHAWFGGYTGASAGVAGEVRGAKKEKEGAGN